MDLKKAVKASLTAARDYVPIKSGRLRYKFIQLSPDGTRISVKITGYNYPDLINNKLWRISNSGVKGGLYTKDWEKRFCNAFAERLAKNLGGKLVK